MTDTSNMRKFLTLISALSLFCFLGGTPCLASVDCFAPLRDSLIKGGYSADLDCSKLHVQLKKVGALKVAAHTYVIYDFRYKTIPPSESMSPHGGQRIFVFSNNGAYLGEYVLSPPPFASIRITNHSLRLDGITEPGKTVEFAGGVPPKQAWLDGYLVDFEK